jgi:two-component system cell cycle sensor histidine kinase/response regulator CckA
MKPKTAEKISLRVLYLEHSREDVEIVRELLTDAGYDVDLDLSAIEKEFVSLLRSSKYDIILSDFKLPGFDAFGALRLSIDICPDVPFICFSGSIGEETAIELLKQGAVDYVLKDRMARLPSAIKRALDAAKEKESRRQAEKALRESERRFQKLTEISPVGIFQTDAEGSTTYVNPRWSQISGMSKEEALGTGWLIGVHNDDREKLRNGWIRATQVQGSFMAEYRFVRKDGSIVWVMGQAIPERDLEDKIVGHVGTITDITERKRAEEEIEMLSSVVEQSTDGMAIAGLDGNLTFANEAWCTMHGFESSKELLGKSLANFHNQEQLENEVKPFNEKVIELGAYSGEVGHMTRDGKPFPTLMTTTLLKDKRGEPYALAGIAKDITEHRRAEEELRKSEGKFRAIFDNASDGMFLVDLNARKFLMCNVACAKMLGYAREEFPNLDIADIHPAEDLPFIYEQIGKFGRGEEGIRSDIRFKRKDGSILVADLSPAVLTIAEKTYLLIIFKDMTELKRAGENLHLQAAALESSANSMVITDSEGTIRWVNPAFTKMTGYSSSEVLGQNPKILKSGLQDKRFYTQLWNTILSGKVWEGQLTNRRKNGEHYVEEMTITPVRDRGGKITNFIAVKQDITDRKRAEEALQESKEQYQQLVENINEVIFSLDRNGVLTYISPAVSAVSGFSPAELIGHSFSDFILQEDLTVAQIGFQRILKGEPGPSDFRVRTKSGEYRWVRSSSRPVVKEGEVRSISGALMDITGQKKAEENILRALQSQEAIFEGSRDAVFICDANSSFVAVNKAACELTGRTREELLKMHFPDLHEEPDREVYRTIHDRIMGGEEILSEARIVRKDGSKVEAEFSNTRIFIGGTPYMHTAARDISDRKRGEEALKDEKALMDALMDNIPDSIYFKDRQCRMVRINRKMMKDLELEEVSQAVGKTDVELFGEEFGRKTLVSDRRLIETGKPIVGMLESRQLDDGRINWTLTTKVPLRDEGGQITGLVGITSEINELMRAQEALRENEQRLKVALTCADIMVFNQNKDLRYTWAFNPQLGILPDAVIGKTDKDLFPRVDISRLIEIKRKVLESGVGVREEVLMTLDQQEIAVLFSVEPLRDSSGAIIGLTGAMIDITQRKLAELEIRRNREWLQAILDASRDGIVAEKDETIAYANASFARVYGYDDPAELVGKPATVVLAPEESRRLMDFGRRRLLGESVPNAYEFKGMQKDGKVVQLEASVSTAFVAGEEYIISTVRDISEQKLLQRQLVEAQKMESIGTLAGGIAHDFNNILGIIMGHSSLLERRRGDSEKYAQSADAISKATFRGAGLVRQLLTFARKTDVVMQSVLINDTLKELAKLLEEILPKTIVMQLDLDDKLPSIHADPTQMHQVFLNLCVNARDAMTPKGGTLTLTSRLVSGEAVSTKFSRAAAMEYVVVDAADSGAGMDAATRSRIFEPFFTTKEKGKGTGLGLATVYGIVESHQGFIDVESTAGVGSTFHVYLPVEPRQVKRDELEKAAEKEIPGGTETILVVEDEETLRDLICLVLESKGYKVLQASDGDEGLQQFTEHQQEIALVLSDLGLPKISGQDLLNRIRELKPDAKIILASGYVEPGMRSELLKGGAKEIIQKPYVPVEVLRKIREVLDSDQ